MHTHDSEINALRHAIIEHPLLSKLQTLEDWQVFMEHHVYAVWDFMALLKRLQKEFAGHHVPWVPPASARLARFINEIVLAEECDKFGDTYLSHCEIYLRAMQECGADTQPFKAFVHGIAGGRDDQHLLREVQAPVGVQSFVAFTLDVAQHKSVAEVCAVFLWGRENLIPDMFSPLLDLLGAHRIDAPCLRHYLQRHIELDGAEHGPLAAHMMETIYKQARCHPSDMQSIAQQALRMRIKLWDSIAEAVDARRAHHAVYQTCAQSR